MGLSYNLRKYREGDEQAILELMNAAFGKWPRLGRSSAHALDYWIWKYKKNPAGSPIIWVAENKNKIIGHYGMIPIKIKVGNSHMIGLIGCDAAVHPKYQGRGVFSSVVNRCSLDAAENGIPLTYGFAQIRLGPTYKRYERKGHICSMVYMCKALNWEPLLNKYIHNRFLSRIAATMLGKICRSKSAPNSLRIERISRFDPRIDKFCETISKQFKIIVKRDQRYLNWRYVDDPRYKYTIYTAMKDNRILGYCVLRREKRQNLTIGFIADILGFQNNTNVVDYLIERAQKHFKEHDVDVIGCGLSEKHPYKAIFRKAGFIEYPLARTLALYATINLRGSSIDEKEAYSQALTLSQSRFLKEKRNWFMMLSDND
jgi:predicted N-acetyltransferase YhbS